MQTKTFYDFIKKHSTWSIIAGSALLYLILKVLMITDIIGAFYQMILLKILVEIILALGLNLITGITGQFSLGHAGFMAVGAYSAAFYILRSDGSLPAFLIALLIGGILSCFVGILISFPTVRLRGDYLAIATLGLGEIIRIVIQNTDQSLLGGASGLSGYPMLNNFELIFISCVVVFMLIRNFVKSSYGRACIAVREDEIASESMGINLTKIKMAAFGVGTFFAGVAGALYISYVSIITPKDFGFMKSIDLLMIVVLGSLGNIWGTIIAAIVLNIVSMFLQSFSELRMIVYAIFLIIIMLLKMGKSPFLDAVRRVLNQICNKLLSWFKALKKRIKQNH